MEGLRKLCSSLRRRRTWLFIKKIKKIFLVYGLAYYRSSSRTTKTQAFLSLYSSSGLLTSFLYVASDISQDALYREDFSFNSQGLADIIVIRTRGIFAPLLVLSRQHFVNACRPIPNLVT